MALTFANPYIALIGAMTLHTDSCKFMDQPMWIWVLQNLVNFQNFVQNFDMFYSWCTCLKNHYLSIKAQTCGDKIWDRYSIKDWNNQ